MPINFKSFCSVFLGFIFIADFALANGGWVSSGGEVFKNGKNPWFVNNTKVINYCVRFSPSEFSADESTALRLVRESLAYWKEQLDGQASIILDAPILSSKNQIIIAQQEFKFSAICTGTEDLTIKFGYDTLDAAEKTYMVTPEKYLGLTIRKNYDDAQLRGNGIIYISGDVGAHAYKKTSPDVIDAAWKYPKLLNYVLIHELGHVFGLSHSGSGLMSEVFLDQMLIRKFAALYVREPISPFIKPPVEAEVCDSSVFPKGSQSFLAPYFSLTYKEDCLKLEMNQNKKQFAILTKKMKGTDWKQIGTLFIDQNEIIDYSLRPALTLQVTDEQKIFKMDGTSFILGPIYQNYKVDGHINFGTSLKPFPVQIDLSPDNIVVYGLHENRLRQVFSFGNPLLYSLSSPF
ncbi:MAG: hypothetical protein V4654_00445 [Bdellovibrionota bacterium]